MSVLALKLTEITRRPFLAASSTHGSSTVAFFRAAHIALERMGLAAFDLELIVGQQQHENLLLRCALVPSFSDKLLQQELRPL